MEYLDLTLRLDTGEGDGLVVRLVDSPAGQAEAPFVLPEVDEEVERTAEGFERLLDAEEPYRDVSPQRSGAGDRQRRIGDQLFRALFPEPIRDLYNRSVGHLGSDPDQGLRIKLQMNLGNPRLAAAHGLPWECLYRAQDGTFLGRDRRTSIVRYLDLPQPGGRPSLQGPLRVLVVTAQPRDRRPLPHLERERSALIDLGRPPSGLEVVPLATPTLAALRNALLSGGFHVLHFLGHGAFDAATGEGLLYLEDGAGGLAPVSGPLLADLLRDITSLRLVVLNACQTARSAALGAFGGVATALLRTGLPAVVAMQFPISDRAASTFGAALYSRLALGDPIDAAVAEGRLTIRRDLPDSAEWATPVLFLRAPDGRLFEPRRRTRKSWAAAALAAAVLGLAASLFLLQTDPPDVGHDPSSRRDRATPPAPQVKTATSTPLPVDPQAGAATPREERAPDPPAERPAEPTSDDRAGNSVPTRPPNDAGHTTRPQKSAKARDVEAPPSMELEWVRIPGGTFSMGSDSFINPVREVPVSPAHRVRLDSFYITKTEVTVAQYRKCVEASRCSEPRSGSDCTYKDGADQFPVNCVSWFQAQEFASFVGQSVSLPTEAEWEYAARSAGKDRLYTWLATSSQPSCELAVMGDCPVRKPREVCSRPKGNSEQGLCDMLGNVWEYTLDWSSPYPTDAVTQDNPGLDPEARDPESGSRKVIRGGTYSTSAEHLVTVLRSNDPPDNPNPFVGFRLVKRPAG